VASAADVAAKLRRLGGDGFRRVVEQSLVAAALKAEQVAKDNVRAVTVTRTGNLYGSITGFVRTGDQGPEAVVRAGGRSPDGRWLGYARTIEYGSDGPITPKRGRYLRIPLPAARTAAGVDRFGGPLRTMAPGLFRVIKAKATGKLYLLHIPSGKLWYRLVESVTIRPRPFLRPGAEVAAGLFPRYLAKNLSRALNAP
jgi:hypothetical protein